MRKVPQIDFLKMYQLFFKCHDMCHSPVAAIGSDMSNVTVILTGSAIKNWTSKELTYDIMKVELQDP